MKRIIVIFLMLAATVFGGLDAFNGKVINVNNPSNSKDAVNLQYLDGELLKYLLIDGTRSMTGNWDVGGFDFTNMDQLQVNTNATINNIVIDANSITSTGGIIDFADENLFTTGLINSVELGSAATDNYWFGDITTMSAGANLSGANNNIAIGSGAGQNITGADDNILVGTNAGHNFGSTSSRNIAIGSNAIPAVSTATVDNIIIGDDACLLSSGGSKSVVIGNQAGTLMSTGQNVLVGYNAGGSITNDINCTFIGYEAGRGSTGNSNTFIGANAGTNAGVDNNVAIGVSCFSNASGIGGSRNVVIGNSAMSQIAPSPQDDNIAIGFNTLDVLNGGDRNIAIGRESLDTVAGGSDNIGMGFQAGSAITSGNNNIAIGANTLDAATTASNLIAIGQIALTANTSGTNNVALGTGAGASLTTGARNLLIGTDTGAALTAADDNNIMLGYLAGKYETGSNSLYIDSLDRTDEATAKTNSLIYGTFNADPASQTLAINADLSTPYNITATGTIQATTLTDGVLSINSGSITDAVNGTFSGLVQSNDYELTGGSGTIFNGELILEINDTDGRFKFSGGTVNIDSSASGISIIEMGDIAGSPGTFRYDSDEDELTWNKDLIILGETTLKNLTGPSGIYIDAFEHIVTTAPVDGDLGFWNLDTPGGILSPTSTVDVELPGDLTVDGIVAINTPTPLGRLDIATGAGLAIVFGADVNATTRTDSTQKFGRFGFPHWDLDEQVVAAFVGNSEQTRSTINIGGGSGSLNAATHIQLKTAVNNTTTQGSTRLYINNNGLTGINTINPLGRLDVSEGAGLAFVFGGDVNASTRTTNVRKFGRFGVPHYNLSERVVGVFVGDMNATTNTLNFGGGSDALNSATTLNFRTAANNTTTTGTIRMQIDSAGNTKIGDGTNETVISATGGLSFHGTSKIDWAELRDVADSITTVTGTGTGAVATIQTKYDGSYYHVDEVVGGSEVIFDFENVTAFNRFEVSYYYKGSTSHLGIANEVWNWTTESWDRYSFCPYFPTQGLTLREDMCTKQTMVPDDVDYIGTDGDVGNVRIRLMHYKGGNGAHDLDVDFVALYQ